MHTSNGRSEGLGLCNASEWLGGYEFRQVYIMHVAFVWLVGQGSMPGSRNAKGGDEDGLQSCRNEFYLHFQLVQPA